jgi:glucosamine--fructose-6-phosphate aminotransferase (isomerizing)
VIYTHAGIEIGVASTKAFTSQLAALSLLAVHLGRQVGAMDADAARTKLTALAAVPAMMEKVIEATDGETLALAHKYLKAKNFLFLGRGMNFPIALEGALKLKEISYIHAEGYAAGEMKHGPIALIDESMPVVVVATQGSHYDKIMGNLQEAKARDGKIIAIGTEGDDRIGQLADDVILIPDVDNAFQPLLTVLPLQLFAYHVANLLGTDVDQPRNLAKSVTVE